MSKDIRDQSREHGPLAVGCLSQGAVGISETILKRPDVTRLEPKVCDYNYVGTW